MHSISSKSPTTEEIANNSQKNNSDIMKSHNINDYKSLNFDDEKEFSPLLTCIRSIQGSDALWGSEKLNHFKQLSLKELRSEQNPKYEDGFCLAVSLQDGSTLYVSSAITRHLGYPKDMLVGHCIMNFLYQKDHVTFANHLSQGLNACFNQGVTDESPLIQNTFFCRLRVYHGLKFGYCVSKKTTQYKPFKVTLHINDLVLDDVCVEKSTSTLCCKATAIPVFPAYQAPEEIPAMTSFSTRHTASCHFSHVDASAIPYLGYLPQDMIGYSVFDFYHTDDMPQLKDIYELVVKERGSSFRSKPYRFKVSNGCYITLETEWSCFINPWSRKLEFVVGQHRVIKGPTDINIFDPCILEEEIASEEILKESQVIQKEIRNMLMQPIKDCAVGKSKRFCNKRKRDLASFVYNFIDDEGKKRQGDQQGENYTSSDTDSVAIGDISPHQDVNDSSTFSETPPSCQEMRYKENIERFFASQPKMFSDGSEKYKSDKKQLSTATDSTGTSSRSNGGSDKQQERLPSTSSIKAAEDQKQQQESSSTSSKYMSSLTNGDSGYKSNKTVNASNSSAIIPNNTPIWNTSSVTDEVEKYPCITLTEESLQQHNRMTHKHVKHRKSKTGHSDWLKHDSMNVGSVSHKHRKCARIQTDFPSAVLTQTEKPSQQAMYNVNPPFSLSNFGVPTVSTSTSNAPNFPAYGIPSFPYISSSYSPNTNTPPFVIPVMYMGTLPCYPAVPNIVPVNNVPMWPYATPVPPHGSPVFPTMPDTCLPTMPAHGLSNSQNPLVQPSGATATTTVLTTTTTVAPGLLSFSEKTKKFENTNLSWCVNKTNFSANTKDASMLIDDSPPSSFAPSSSSEALTYSKGDSMDFELLRKNTRPVREDPFWLSGVDLTNDVVYRYKVSQKKMEDVLMKDMEVLKTMTQPPLVNKQLELLRQELQCNQKDKLEDLLMLSLTTNENNNEKGELMDSEDNLFDFIVQNE